MNCPECGLPALPGQKFCRSCGSGLQIITQPLAERAAVSDLERTPATSYKDEKQQANRLIPWGFIIMFIGVAIGIIGKMLMHDEMVTVAGALASVAGMFFTVYPYLSPSPRQKSDSGPPSQLEIPPRSQPGKYLPQESRIEYVPGITERTTDLLKNSTATRPRRKEDRESEA
jgi:hypothetical protein